ncbi:unnamed protein product [Lathyrus sativus]|nr:unnamed protein product [Lathyrus sativus]
MSRTSNYIVHAHYNGETFISENSGFGFQNTDLTRLTMSRKANFVHFKERIQSKILSGQISQIIYRSPIFFTTMRSSIFKRKYLTTAMLIKCLIVTNNLASTISRFICYSAKLNMRLVKQRI